LVGLSGCHSKGSLVLIMPGQFSYTSMRQSSGCRPPSFRSRSRSRSCGCSCRRTQASTHGRGSNRGNSQGRCIQLESESGGDSDSGEIRDCIFTPETQGRVLGRVALEKVAGEGLMVSGSRRGCRQEYDRCSHQEIYQAVRVSQKWNNCLPFLFLFVAYSQLFLQPESMAVRVLRDKHVLAT
jgi:hypothetical protein